MVNGQEQYIEHLMSYIGKAGNRIAFTPEETEAKRRLVSEMKELGLDIYTDEAGNIFGINYANGTKPPKGVPLKVFGMGSHIDSVPNGGNFDGLVGIVSGMAAIKSIKEKGIRLSENIVVIAFESEESTVFGKSCLGSKFVGGKITVEDLHQTAIMSDSFNDGFMRYGEKFRNCNRILGLPLLDRPLVFSSFIEPHIEQGSVLADEGKKVGIVSAIAAPYRVKFKLTGMGGHDGTVPMFKRRDALEGFYELYNIYRGLRHEMEIGDQLRTNIGVVDIENSSINKIPAKISTAISVRGLDLDLMNKFMEEIILRVEKKLPEMDIEVNIQRLEQGIPVKLKPEIVDEVRRSTIGYPTMEMWSGAGHDTAYMTHICAEGAAVFFLPNSGISHEPTEYATIEDISIGARVLEQIVQNRQLSRNQNRQGIRSGQDPYAR